MMQVILDEQGFVKAYALIGGFGTPSVEVNEPENISDFEENYRSYYLSENNELIKNDVKQAEIDEKRELSDLRYKREKQCFPVINRGALWYEHLSKEQKADLDVWYHAWLNVTETRVVPEMPEWLS